MLKHRIKEAVSKLHRWCRIASTYQARCQRITQRASLLVDYIGQTNEAEHKETIEQVASSLDMVVDFMEKLCQQSFLLCALHEEALDATIMEVLSTMNRFLLMFGRERIALTQLAAEDEADLGYDRQLMTEKYTSNIGGRARILNCINVLPSRYQETSEAILKAMCTVPPGTARYEFLQAALDSLLEQEDSMNVEVTDLTVTSYEIEQLDKLGSSLLAETYRGYWMGAFVSVKRLQFPLESQEALAVFVEKMAQWGSLRHPHIHSLLGYCSVSPNPIILTPLPSTTLFAYLRDLNQHANNAQRIVEYIRLMREIAAAVHYVHSRGFVHGSVKVSNVMIDGHGSVQLTDYCHETAWARMMAMAPNSLSAARQAPELKTKVPFSSNTDVYDLGTVMWEAASTLWESAFDLTALRRQLSRTEAPERPEGMPKRVWDMVCQCWADHPHRRPSALQIMEGLKQLDMMYHSDSSTVSKGSLRVSSGHYRNGSTSASTPQAEIFNGYALPSGRESGASTPTEHADRGQTRSPGRSVSPFSKVKSTLNKAKNKFAMRRSGDRFEEDRPVQHGSPIPYQERVGTVTPTQVKMEVLPEPMQVYHAEVIAPAPQKNSSALNWGQDFLTLPTFSSEAAFTFDSSVLAFTEPRSMSAAADLGREKTSMEQPRMIASPVVKSAQAPVRPGREDSLIDLMSSPTTTQAPRSFQSSLDRPGYNQLSLQTQPGTPSMNSDYSSMHSNQNSLSRMQPGRQADSSLATTPVRMTPAGIGQPLVSIDSSDSEGSASESGSDDDDKPIGQPAAPSPRLQQQQVPTPMPLVAQIEQRQEAAKATMSPLLLNQDPYRMSTVFMESNATFLNYVASITDPEALKSPKSPARSKAGSIRSQTSRRGLGDAPLVDLGSNSPTQQRSPSIRSYTGSMRDGMQNQGSLPRPSNLATETVVMTHSPPLSRTGTPFSVATTIVADDSDSDEDQPLGAAISYSPTPSPMKPLPVSIAESTSTVAIPDGVDLTLLSAEQLVAKGRQLYRDDQTEEAFAHFQTAARVHFDPEALCSLGRFYSQGIPPCKVDYTLALEKYTEAAMLGSAEAKFVLASAYLNGEMGVRKDYKLAVTWLGKSAADLNPHAAYLLGTCYERGKGVEKSRTMAIRWYDMAAQGECPGAAQARDRLKKRKP